MKHQIKIVIGKTSVNGFFTVHHGDIYQMQDGGLGVVVSNDYGWQIRHEKDGGPDYSRPPIDGWDMIGGHMEMCQLINRAWGENN
jgi:hypothetical protein